MADIHCPMCGKTNPDHLDACQHCEARLKPLITPSPSQDPENNLPTSSQENTLDWLHSLGQGDEDEMEDDEPLGDLGGDLSDWLTDDSDSFEWTEPQPGSSPEGSPEPSPEGSPEPGGDWLSQMRGESDLVDSDALVADESWLLPEEQAPIEPRSAQDDPGGDWLSQIRNGFQEGEGESVGDSQRQGLQDSPPPQPVPSEDAFPDWLDSPTTSEPSAAEEPGPLPDWLAREPSPQPISEEDKLPDWLDTLR
ncbi:MAG: hypothetical protein ACE5GO_07575, partial [Anaerolineales bacterium]